MSRSDGWDHVYADIGARVCRARKAQGISQVRLAGALHVTRASIVNIEAGRQRTPLHVLWQIALILDVEVADLIPTRAALALNSAPLHLDPDVVKLIEQAAADDDNTKRVLEGFIQQAQSKLTTNSRDAS